MQPFALAPNQPATFYRGSGRLAEFRGMPLEPRPEDWLASTTTRFGQDTSGLSRLPDGRLLRDAIAEYPVAWLGGEHVERYGANPALLVKLLDAGQRLPVHVHPSRAFATAHLGSPYGKTEAWIVLDAAPDAAVRLGFSRSVDADELAGWARTQDVAALLAATNEVPVAAGDAILCPAGVPHAIGKDVLLVELQEPTDFSVLLEWEGLDLGPRDATVGLPLDEALGCVDRRAWSAADLAALRGGERDLLPRAAEPFFLAERFAAGVLPRGFAVLVVTGGSGHLSGAWGRMPIARGATVVVPYEAGPCHVAGDAVGIRCAPSRV